MFPAAGVRNSSNSLSILGVSRTLLSPKTLNHAFLVIFKIFTEFREISWKSLKSHVLKVFPCTRSKNLKMDKELLLFSTPGGMRCYFTKRRWIFNFSVQSRWNHEFSQKICEFKGNFSIFRPASRTVGIHSPFQSFCGLLHMK